MLINVYLLESLPNKMVKYVLWQVFSKPMHMMKTSLITSLSVLLNQYQTIVDQGDTGTERIETGLICEVLDNILAKC